MKRLILLFFVGMALSGIRAQTVTPFVIGGGGSGVSGNMILSWTFGETFGKSLTDGIRWMTQGFHQPVRVSDSIPYSDTSAFIPNGITPNSDGLNDSWVIDGIDTVKNTVYVFNRWGDLVWKASDYNNVSVVWKGDNFNGDLLPVATYFYIISTPQKEYKGWIELLR